MSLSRGDGYFIFGVFFLQFQLVMFSLNLAGPLNSFLFAVIWAIVIALTVRVLRMAMEIVRVERQVLASGMAVFAQQSEEKPDDPKEAENTGSTGPNETLRRQVGENVETKNDGPEKEVSDDD